MLLRMSFDYRHVLLAISALLAACGSKVDITPDGGDGGSGGGEPFAACDGPGQCVLVFNTCCGTCGLPELSDYVAINQDKASVFRDGLCFGIEGCPACGAQENPNLFAFCDNGTCAKADVRTHAVSACDVDSDCRLRYGAGCCESTCSGSEEQLTAVNTSQETTLTGLVCGGDGFACDACVPQYPLDAAPVCLSGHCSVALAN
jgi:hypothetical protein